MQAHQPGNNCSRDQLRADLSRAGEQLRSLLVALAHQARPIAAVEKLQRQLILYQSALFLDNQHVLQAGRKCADGNGFQWPRHPDLEQGDAQPASFGLVDA